MENQNVNANPLPESGTKPGHEWMVSGLWMNIGFIGASALATGVLQLLHGNARLGWVFVLAVGGGALAAFSWWRAQTVLETDDGKSAATAGASRPAGGRTAAAI